MKKSSLLIAIGALLAACTAEAPVEEPAVNPVEISVYIPEGGLTKVAMDQGANPDGAVKLTWESADVITVKNSADESKSVVFSYKSGAGTVSATFSAPDISALSGATGYNIYLSSNLPGGFVSQTQASDGSMSHLGYAATLSGVDKYSSVTFCEDWASANGGGTFESSSVLRIRAQMPTADIADAVQKVTVKSSSYLFGDEDEMSITITTPGVDGDSRVVTVYATLPAGDVGLAADTELLFQFQVSADANDKYTAYRKLASDQTLCSGKVNSFKINCPDIESFAGTDDDGTDAHPYLIGDRHQLDKMRDLLVADTRVYFKMVDDVDLAGENWAPVNNSESYQIDFDGRSHIISNMTIDNSSGSYDYSGFIGYLYGYIHDVVFDGASVNGGSKNSGIVIGRSGASSHAANFRNVTVCNSTLTSSNNYVGGLAGYVKKCNYVANCHVINSTITSTLGNVDPSLVGGLAAEMIPNGGCSVTDCSVKNVTIGGGCTNINRSGVGGLFGRIGDGVVINRCNSSASMGATSVNNVGGLVGVVSGTGCSISNSYFSGTITRGYTYAGGLVGKCNADAGLVISHCFASGSLVWKGGYGGKGGLVGTILGTGVTVENSVAWNPNISGGHATDDYSSGAIVGFTHPNCVLTDNYRKPGMTFNGLFWAPSASFDHANVDGTTTPLQKITYALDESSMVDGTDTDFGTAENKQYFSYHGKHLASGAMVEPDDTYGWVSSDIPGISDPDPEAAGWSDVPTLDFEALGGTKVTVRTGVEWTTFHGTWEGEIRNINIIRTTLDSHNSLGVYYNYTEGGYKYLDEKCTFTDALAGTNGSMACCQFVRVDDVVKRDARPVDGYYYANCALTIDDEDVDIVKVADNYGAALLSNHTVSCAGPLLVWKGNIQTYPEEGSADFLSNTHPRTAIGISKDGNTVIQVAVDGRWTQSASEERAIGMSTALLSELMKGLGCYKAMNFDGGGGTAMWVYGYGNARNVVNHPSDNRWDWNGTGLRATGSAVYVKSDLK